tara:strand:- start:453 stop:1061 length:609 start_codon:yes stop_codon:yes gene_type:complete
MAVARTSELEAINTMLGVIGESPINDLSAVNQTTDVILAKDILTEVSREVQSQGWYFNCEKDVKITPTADNEILIPANAARIDVEAINASSKEYVQRGDKLYNKTDHTFTISTELKCFVIYMLDWTLLPQAARQYIMIRAARKLQDRAVGSTKHHQFNQIDEAQALAMLRADEASVGDHSIFNNYDVGRVIDRGNVVNRITT